MSLVRAIDAERLVWIVARSGSESLQSDHVIQSALSISKVMGSVLVGLFEFVYYSMSR